MKVKHALTVAIPSVLVLGLVGTVLLDVGGMSQSYTEYKLEKDNDIEIEHIQKLTAKKGYVEDMWVDRSHNLEFKTVRKDSPLSGLSKNSYYRNFLKMQADDIMVMYSQELKQAGFLYNKGDVFKGSEYSNKAIKIPVLSEKDVTLFDFNDKLFKNIYRVAKVAQQTSHPEKYYLDIRGIHQGHLILSDLKNMKSEDDVREALGEDVRKKMVNAPPKK